LANFLDDHDEPVAPVASPLVALTNIETQLLDRLLPATIERRKATLSTYLVKIARLGGYLKGVKDSPPGNTVMWRGLSRLRDIELGFLLAVQVVGN
jgi:hypothetical protein